MSERVIFVRQSFAEKQKKSDQNDGRQKVDHHSTFEVSRVAKTASSENGSGFGGIGKQRWNVGLGNIIDFYFDKLDCLSIIIKKTFLFYFGNQLQVKILSIIIGKM